MTVSGIQENQGRGGHGTHQPLIEVSSVAEWWGKKHRSKEANENEGYRMEVEGGIIRENYGGGWGMRQNLKRGPQGNC